MSCIDATEDMETSLSLPGRHVFDLDDVASEDGTEQVGTVPMPVDKDTGITTYGVLLGEMLEKETTQSGKMKQKGKGEVDVQWHYRVCKHCNQDVKVACWR